MHITKVRIGIGIVLVALGLVGLGISLNLSYFQCVNNRTPAIIPCPWDNPLPIASLLLPIGVGSLISGLRSFSLSKNKLLLTGIGLLLVGGFFLYISVPPLVITYIINKGQEQPGCILCVPLTTWGMHGFYFTIGLISSSLGSGLIIVRAKRDYLRAHHII